MNHFLLKATLIMGLFLLFEANACADAEESTTFTFEITKNASGSTPGEVSVKLTDYSAEEIEVPSQVVIDGNTYNVTSIPDYGFTNSKGNQQIPTPTAMPACFARHFPYYTTFISHCNPNLKSVTFEEPCQITSIGIGAFEGCYALTEFVLPYSVETLGIQVWRGCLAMKTFKFQTNENLQTQVREIPTQSFLFCTSLEAIEIPTGVETIGNEALQYNLELTSISLPNTLTTIGTHFVCSAIKLSSLILPASVSDIDGSAFHACESLKTVYLLGRASALQPGEGDGEQTFGGNNCAEGVHDCIFYTTQDYIGGYQADKYIDKNGNEVSNTWQQLDGDNGKNNIGNRLLAIQNTRTLQKGQWATICFATLPSSETEFNRIFGDKDVDSEEGWRVAIMTHAQVDTDNTERGPQKGNPNLYHTYYQTIPFNEIETNTPYLICPGKKVENYLAWTDENETDATFKLNMTANHNVAKQASDGAWVYMVGRVLGLNELFPDDIYFKAVNEVGTDNVVGGFYQVKNGIKVKLGHCRAYWHIYQDGIKSKIAALGGAKRVNNAEDVDAINEINNDVRVVVSGIYDMNGRKLNVTQEQLPKGMYIMDGKKMLVK